MRIQNWTTMDESARRQLLERGLSEIFDPELRTSIDALIDDVRHRGDHAVCDALAKFDQVDVTPDGLAITDDELESAQVDDAVDAAIDDAIAHLRAFNERQVEGMRDWSFESEPGLTVGEKIGPITSVGLFTPSGKASYPSVTYQLAVPALVAGVPEITVVVPPVPGQGGAVDPAVLVVCRKLGLRRVFRVNGPAGIAALGFGTERIDRARKVVGPGSPAVTLAQVEMQRFGVTTMMLLGPTESVIIADETADPARAAADLLIEAEHGSDSSVVLLTPSRAFAETVDAHLVDQIGSLPTPRADAARSALGTNGGAVIVADLEEAAAVSNAYAPEHLQVAVADADRVIDMLEHAGEILIGQDTPFSAANFLIGCPASLPTSGFAHVSSGITAATFMKRTAIARANGQALARMGSSIIALASHEGFPAHASAIQRRLP